MPIKADRTKDRLREQARKFKEQRSTRSLLEVVEDLARDSRRIVHVETIPAREAQTTDPEEPLPEQLQQRLLELGIEKLYTHQAQAIDLLRKRNNVVVVTGTASGKTLCYNLPVLERLIQDPGARALYLFPTKALAQDQLKALSELGAVVTRKEAKEREGAFRAGTYDGDTPGHLRRRIRDDAQIILTNPDMLHAGILPHHSRWADFFSRLDTIVIDELHVYRGVFGSNVANVLRRLLRIMRHYGVKPRIVAASATIANPKELAESLTGLPFELVNEDGSPRGTRHFILWNPERLTPDGMERRSTNMEARDLMVHLMAEGYQAIAFVRARLTTEVLLRYIQDELEKKGGGLASRLRAYRGGYLPQERREIEGALFSGELLGVVSTNALELGIDVGSLDASLLVGYPGTIASTWQQAGRAGRREDESVSIFMGHNLPIDQYLMRHPDYFFARNPEHAVVDPSNPHILIGHLRCAAFELPLDPRDAKTFGEYTPALRKLLEEFGHVKTIRGRAYFSRTDYPAGEINLRTASIHTYTIVRSTPDGNKVIGTMDEPSAFSQLHPEAVYMHDAETYLVDDLNLEERVAYVHAADIDYYTQAVSDTQILINEVEREKTWNGAAVAFGNVSVTDTEVIFKKIKFGSRDSIGYGNIDLPAQVLHTTSCWLSPPNAVVQQVMRMGKVPAEGLLGLSNLLGEVVPLFAMCDRRDVGTAVDLKNTGVPAVFIYDKYPGGLGFSQKVYRLLPEILEACRLLATECDCDGGCPSCVGSPIPPYSQQDPDTMGKGRIPDKDAALVLLHALLGLDPYVPKGGPPPEKDRELSPAARESWDEEEEQTVPQEEPDWKRLPKEVEKRLRELLEEALSSRPRRKDEGEDGPSSPSS
jgi:DEAD/DEAH box helicase domain-containing protein